jgi:hypothetical protein
MIWRLIFFLTVIAGLALTQAVLSAQDDPLSPPFDPWAGVFQVRNEIPFVWIRSEPDVNGAILETIPSGGIVRTQPLNLSDPDDTTFWDHVHRQWWGMVFTSHTSGWVEMHSFSQIAAGESYSPPQIDGQQPANWQMGNVVRVRASVPFVLLRIAPNSDAATKANPQTGSLLVIVGRVQSDQTQFWWPVRDPNGPSVGFVEQSSLEFVRTSRNFPLVPLDHVDWLPGFKIRVKSDIPFVWLRQECHSDAEIVYTILSGQEVWIPGGLPIFDGLQYWRLVSIPGRSPISGCVEVNSFEFSGVYP